MKTISIYSSIIFYLLISGTGLMFAQEKKSSADSVQFRLSLFRQYEIVSEANRGNAVAQHTLGLCYLGGVSFPADTAKAIYWIKKAADNNLPAAHYNYGVMLYNGTGVEWNPFEAYRHVMYAAKVKMREAMYLAGIFYSDNLVVPKDTKLADYYFNYSSDTSKRKTDSLITAPDVIIDSQTVHIAEEIRELTKGDESYSSYGNILLKRLTDGRMTKDFPEAVKDTALFNRIKRLAAEGNSDADVLLGICSEKGIPEKNDIAALEYYFRAISLDSQTGNIFLIKFYRNKNEFEKRLKHINDEVKKNNPAAMYVLYKLTSAKFSFTITQNNAFQLLKKAASMGHNPSIVELGLCYFRGHAVDKDPDKAMEFFKLASTDGCKEADIWAANLNIQEGFRFMGAKETIDYLTSAADKGVMHAIVLLAYCYENGVGATINEVKAARLYRSAWMRGNQGAYAALRRMHDKLRPASAEFAIPSDN